MKNGKTDSDGDPSDSENEEDVAPEVNSEPNNSNAEWYYTSGLWKQKEDNTFTSTGEIERPQHPDAQASHAHSHPSPQQFKLMLLFNNYLFVQPNPTESQAGTFHHNILNLH